jgi:hypothetical protein
VVVFKPDSANGVLSTMIGFLSRAAGVGASAIVFKDNLTRHDPPDPQDTTRSARASAAIPRAAADGARISRCRWSGAPDGYAMRYPHEPGRSAPARQHRPRPCNDPRLLILDERSALDKSVEAVLNLFGAQGAPALTFIFISHASA